jgi:hypothetical protein
MVLTGSMFSNHMQKLTFIFHFTEHNETKFELPVRYELH